MLFLIANGPIAVATMFTPVATGIGLKTMLQVKPKPGVSLVLAEWGFSGDKFTALAPGIVELIEVDDDATVTASVDADVSRLTDPTGPEASEGLIVLGTGATGYTATVEGTVTSARWLDAPQQLPPSTAGFFKQIPLGNGPVIAPGKYARIRCNFPASVNVICWMVFGPKGQM